VEREVVVALGLVGLALAGGITDTSRSPFARLRPIPLGACRWTGGFWAQKLQLCRAATVPAIEQALEDPQNGAVRQNFLVAAALKQGKHLGCHWSDGDCYKWLEALAHLYALTRDPALNQKMDYWVAAIARAQKPDGYLSTNIQLTDKKRWENPHHHELYNMGHLLTAACIHYRATGKTTLLAVARKLADYLYETFHPRPAALAHFGFNPSHIMGLVELYRTTGERRYLDLANTFITMRGSAPGGSDLNQDRVALRHEREAVGHAVTACYLYCGAADYCLEAEDSELRAALERIWRNVVERRMYVTGAVGALPGGLSTRGDRVHEAFGRDYELPPRTAYCETCANIANAMWNWRMLLLTGQARFADILELVLYNSMLSALSADGKAFFYCNPLEWTGERRGLSRHHTPTRWTVWRCYCCPTNVVRTIAKLGGYAYSLAEGAVWVNLYGSNSLKAKLPDGSPVEIAQETDYPWDGAVKLTVERAPSRPMALLLRIPAWAHGATIAVNGTKVAGNPEPGTYARVERQWRKGDTVQLTLPMRVRLLVAHPRVVSLAGKVAVARGPVVYCLESHDLPAGLRPSDVALLPERELEPRFLADFLGGAVVLQGEGIVPSENDRGLYRQLRPPRGRRVPLRLIPYFAWANRGEGQMAAWLLLR